MSAKAMQLALRKTLEGGRIIAAGVDALTVTSTLPAAQECLLYIFNRGAAQAERLGDNRKKMGFQGFQGWKIGPWFYGRREDLWLLRVMGAPAHDCFHDLPWPGLNCSRVDVQITLQLPAYDSTVARQVGDLRKAAATEAKGKPRPAQDLHGLYSEGQTLDIGSRESPRFGRVYNKQEESGEEVYERSWRFEVEYKKVCAPLVAAWLRQEPDLRIAAIQSCVGQFEEWGVPLAVGVAGKLIAGSIGRRDFDSERSMKWLREQVAPTIEKLRKTVDQESIEEALGLRVVEHASLPPVTAAWVRETGQTAPSGAQRSQAAQDAKKWW